MEGGDIRGAAYATASSAASRRKTACDPLTGDKLVSQNEELSDELVELHS